MSSNPDDLLPSTMMGRISALEARPDGGAAARALTLGNNVVLTATSVLVPFNIFSFDVEAGKTYSFEIVLAITAVSGTAPTCRFGFTGPIGAALRAVGRHAISTSVDAVPTWIAFGDDAVLRAAAVNTVHLFKGAVIVGGTPGMVNFRCAAVGGTTPSITVHQSSTGLVTG